MEIIKYSELINADKTIKNDEPMIAAISFDGKTAVLSHIDEAVAYHILLSKAGFQSTDADKFFRIVFDQKTADWAFICPADYKNIADKTERINEFYKDGFAAISSFLAEIGYYPDINIPKRYRRHFEE